MERNCVLRLFILRCSFLKRSWMRTYFLIEKERQWKSGIQTVTFLICEGQISTFFQVGSFQPDSHGIADICFSAQFPVPIIEVLEGIFCLGTAGQKVCESFIPAVPSFQNLFCTDSQFLDVVVLSVAFSRLFLAAAKICTQAVQVRERIRIDRIISIRNKVDFEWLYNLRISSSLSCHSEVTGGPG